MHAANTSVFSDCDQGRCLFFQPYKHTIPPVRVFPFIPTLNQNLQVPTKMSSLDNPHNVRFETFQSQFDRLRKQVADQMSTLEQNAKDFKIQRESLWSERDGFYNERAELIRENLRLQRKLEQYEDDEWYQDYANKIWKNRCVELKEENNKLLKEQIGLRHQLFDAQLVNEELELKISRLKEELNLLKVTGEEVKRTFFCLNTKKNPYAH